MALLIAVIIFLVLLVWNLETFVKKQGRLPRVREILTVHKGKDSQSFLFLFFVAAAFFIAALYLIFNMGLFTYFQTISFGSYLNTAFFAAFVFSYFVRFSIYLENEGTLNVSEQYLFKLWKVKLEDAKTQEEKYKLILANVVVSVFAICIFVQLFN